MQIMVIDRESLTNQLIASKLEARGHQVVTFQNKNEAFEVLRQGAFDCIMVDPSPLSEAKPVIFAVWRNVTSAVKPYVILLSKAGTTEEAILSGANDVLNKPLSAQDIETRLANAERLMEISRHLSTEDDAHSGGGMVGKAAFNQLFLSALDRAFRYAERSLIVFIHMSNYDDIAAAGQEAVDETLKKLNEKMTYMRRQSDVIGRIGRQDFAIMLQRPQFESEPLDAINRFTEQLEKFHHSFAEKSLAPRLELHLVEVPQGQLHAEKCVPAPVAGVAEGQQG